MLGWGMVGMELSFRILIRVQFGYLASVVIASG